MPDSVMLGAGHRQILMDLDARIKALQAGEDRPRVVLLQGSSGVGKSRIIRELYRWWADRQSSPAYWPPLPEIGAPGPAGTAAAGMGTATAALANRKVIGPLMDGFIWPPGALPQFTWWPFNCGSMSTGDAIDVIAEIRPLVQAHLRPVTMAWRRSAGVAKRLGKLDRASAERFRELLEEGLTEVVGDALKESLGVALPGLGLIINWGGRGIKTVREKRAAESALAGSVDLGAAAAIERQSAAEQVAAVLLAIASPTLPAVVVIEDIHLMGEPFAQFLQILQALNPEHPVLIVGTAWPEAHDRGVYAAWRDQARQAGQLDVIEMPALPADDLREFVLVAAPATAADDVERLIGHYPNPFALQLFLGLDSTRLRINRDRGALAISASDLAGLPREDVRDLYRAMWHELPDSVRAVLTVAAGVLPPSADLTWPFLSEVVTAACVATGRLQAADAVDVTHRALQAAIDVHRWIVPTQPSVAYRFREATLDDIAAESLDNTGRHDMTNAAIAYLREEVDNQRASKWWIDIETADDRTLLIARWLWELLPTDEPVTATDFAAAFLAAQALSNAHQPAAAYKVLDRHSWQHLFPTDRPARDLIRSMYASWAAEARNFELAVSELQALVADQVDDPGLNDPEALVNRGNLAYSLWQAGRVEEAIAKYLPTLDDQTRELGPNHLDTLATRNNLVSLLAEEGRIEQALDAYRRLLPTVIERFGTSHPNTFATRGNLADLMGRAGLVNEAVTELRDLLESQLQRPDLNHPGILNTRNNLAYWLGQTGQVADTDEALAMYGALLPELDRRFGADDFYARTSRNSFTDLLSRAGGSHHDH